MTESDQESKETTENFIKAMEEWVNNPPPARKIVTRMLYAEDGRVLGLTQEAPKPGELWVEVDYDEFVKEFNPYSIHLKYIDGKVVDTRPKSDAIEVQLKEGDTWHADNEYRLITGEPGVNTSGWSRKTD